MKNIIIVFTIAIFLLACNEKPAIQNDIRKSIICNNSGFTSSNKITESGVEKQDTLIIQQCNFNDLSDTLGFKVRSTHILDEKNEIDSFIVQIFIYEKPDLKIVSSIKFSSLYLRESIFGDCVQTRSFTTKKSISELILDGFYGNFIIADFNFDSREDIAVIGDIGGNGGPLYRFYIQDDTRKFKLDYFLTKKMIFFPEVIDSANKSLVTRVRANTYQRCEIQYTLDKVTNRWKTGNRKFIE